MLLGGLRDANDVNKHMYRQEVFVFLFKMQEVEPKQMLAAPHPEHDTMFNVEQDLFLLPVVSDEGVQGVTVGHPANQA